METKQFLLIVTVPASHLHDVLDAIGEAGAGQIGNYTHCAFFSPGTGRFKPNEAANPALGEKSQINEVEEYRIETFCSREKISDVIAALRKAHPYEEPVYYLLPLMNDMLNE
ncbi:MAG TPA: hypothetical protein VK003_06175 [Oceanobacillus sp.]|nr:hypothetical protein [Oceanobacillus sp.]